MKKKKSNNCRKKHVINERDINKQKRELHYSNPTPRSIWFRPLREYRRRYRRNFVYNDAAYCGGIFDRDYLKSRDCEKESTKRAYEKENPFMG